MPQGAEEKALATDASFRQYAEQYRVTSHIMVKPTWPGYSKQFSAISLGNSLFYEKLTPILPHKPTVAPSFTLYIFEQEICQKFSDWLRN